MLSARRQKGLTSYCSKNIDTPFCLRTDELFVVAAAGESVTGIHKIEFREGFKLYFNIAAKTAEVI